MISNLEQGEYEKTLEHLIVPETTKCSKNDGDKKQKTGASLKECPLVKSGTT